MGGGYTGTLGEGQYGAETEAGARDAYLSCLVGGGDGGRMLRVSGGLARAGEPAAERGFLRARARARARVRGKRKRGVRSLQRGIVRGLRPGGGRFAGAAVLVKTRVRLDVRADLQVLRSLMQWTWSPPLAAEGDCLGWSAVGVSARTDQLLSGRIELLCGLGDAATPRDLVEIWRVPLLFGCLHTIPRSFGWAL